MRSLSAVLAIALAACASHPAPTEPAPYAHRFDHAEAWAKELDDPARDEWQKPERVIRPCR